MKIVVAALLLALFAGCSSDPEDRAFFNTGWLSPERGANERLYRPNGISVKSELSSRKPPE